MKNNLKTSLPNIITSIRIILSACLLFMNPDNISFLFLYGITGFTDVLDGYLARKWKVSSKIGAMLDSVADFIFIMVLLVIFIPMLAWKDWMPLWIAIIALIRITSLLIGGIKFHTIAFIHTLGNKVTGLLLFCFPFLLQVSRLRIIVIIICGVASISALEELIIMIRSKTLNRDQKGLRDNA